MKRRRTILTTAVVLTSAVLITVTMNAAIPAANNKYPEPNPVGWMFLPDTDKQPQGFEPYLEEHPHDFDRRAAALVWYSRREFDLERLKQHTFAMIAQHPESMHVYFANITPFYVEPPYRNEVIAQLEQQLEHGHANADVYSNLAQTCEQGALPHTFTTPETRQFFLHYFNLPEDTALPTEVDQILADKALKYYRLAIETAVAEMKPLYAKQLVRLLSNLDNAETACEQARQLFKSMPEIKQDADFLYTYGRSLNMIGRPEKAKQLLEQVRQYDREGFEDGPAHITMQAEQLLGVIALDAGDVSAAEHHLLTSLDVQLCCHTSSRSISRTLAPKLLEQGKHETVIKYCETALEKFAPDNTEILALLKRAQAASEN